MGCLGSAKLTMHGINWIQFCVVWSTLQLMRNVGMALQTRYAEVFTVLLQCYKYVLVNGVT